MTLHLDLMRQMKSAALVSSSVQVALDTLDIYSSLYLFLIPFTSGEF